MEQVYYTQCPMGHGLGAAGGFQLKRISPGYPRTADFRSLGLKVQMSGLSVLSPRALRFRWDGQTAEIAWLAPRAREFEVASADGSRTRQYGRPGGLFAHGLRLSLDELALLESWPAGLYAWPHWVESDPVPTAGQNLEPLELTDQRLLDRRWQPRLSDLAGPASQYSPERLATLLHSVAQASRTGRSLFLYHESNEESGERLAEIIAILTLAFPRPLRRQLTFSTFHDRPSALPGFRIQGTNSLGKSDLPSMQALGIVEPLHANPPDRSPPPLWASTLARWLLQGDDPAWSASCDDLFPLVSSRVSPQEVWDDSFLDSLFSFVEWNGLPPDQLADRSVRDRLRPLVAWVERVGLTDLWKQSHTPDWWLRALRASTGSGTACSLMLAQARWPPPSGATPPSPEEIRLWAQAVALGFASRSEADWQTALRSFLQGRSSRDALSFLSALLAAVPDRAESTLAWLQESAIVSASLVLPLWAVRQLGPPPAIDALRKILDRAILRPEILLNVLDVLQTEASIRHQPASALSPALADALFAARASTSPDAWQSLWSAIVSRTVSGPDPSGWLSALLARTFSPPFDPEDWSALAARLGPDDRSRFAPLALAATRDLPGDGRAYLWCVESLWLSLSPDHRNVPLDNAWITPYLDRLPPTLDTFRRLFPPPGHDSALSLWIADVRQRTPAVLSPQTLARLDSWERVERARQNDMPASMLQIDTADIPPSDRGRWLARILEGLGQADRPGYLEDLSACGQTWSEVFASGSPHLLEVAEPLAAALQATRHKPLQFLDLLRSIEQRLGVQNEPDALRSVGLAAHVLLAATRDAPQDQIWPLRKTVLDSPDWPILRLDLESAIQAVPPSDAPGVAEIWDTLATEGNPRLAVPLHTLLLNACSGASLAQVASARATYLKGDPLPWWDHDQHSAARDDARDRFVRTVPMAPLPYDQLPALRAWLGKPPADFDEFLQFPPSTPAPETDDSLLVSDDNPLSPPSQPTTGLSHVSTPGLARWCCLHALSTLSSGGDQPSRDVYDRIRLLPLDRLDLDDRYRFLAWVLLLTDLSETTFADPLARWLVQNGVLDDERLKNWSSVLHDQAGEEASVQKPGVLEFIHALRREVRLIRQEQTEKAPGASRTR